MLLALANWIASDVRAFSVFGYITLRGVLATMTALVISFVVGPSMIRKLTQYKIEQAVRDDGPQSHLIKAGTPTMGGALILVSIAITTLLCAGVWGFIVLSYCVIVGASNAVNLTDGLDGLAIMPTAMIAGALGIFAYAIGRADFSNYLLLPHIPGAGELTVICGAIVGAGLGFL